ncbi:MAG: NAD(P)/FAD-dependent oxidoreductase [Anaerolineales bacterium]
MSSRSAEVVICGAGIAGISTAYHLTVGKGVEEVLIVDERPPLSLTSDKSTECYRNWWPGPGDAMVSLMNRSIDILEELSGRHGNPFNLNRRGYLFATAQADQIEDFRAQGEEAASLGAGPLRIHDGSGAAATYRPAPASGYKEQPTGSDLITDRALIAQHFPYLTEETLGVLHVRRAGWLDGQQLGRLLLEQARFNGAQFLEGRVSGVDVEDGRVHAVRVDTPDGSLRVATRNFVNAAGPFLKEVGAFVGADLPVFAELHAKVAIQDRLGAFPRDAPMLIWTDPQYLPWQQDEREALLEDAGSQYLLEQFPQGAHGRPEGPADSPIVLLIWTYETKQRVDPTFPLKFDPNYPEIAMRGLATFLPAMGAYFDSPPRPIVDGGYYLKTEENRPLIGPMGVEGAWVIGALSGFGLMASPAAGELLVSQIAGEQPPEFARWFDLDRYDDPEYQALLANWGRSGQL